MSRKAGGKRLHLFPIVDFAKEVYLIWVAERPTQLAAALAYFGLFSFAPVFYFALRIAGIFFDKTILFERIMDRLEMALGASTTQTVQTMLDRLAVDTTSENTLVALISFVFLLLAASGVFLQLQFSLNTVWKVPYSPQGALLRTIRKHLFSFLMVIGVGLLLVAAAVFSFFANWLSSFFVLFGIQPSLTAAGLVGLATLSFGVMYKLLPDVKIAWRDVWGGAAAAASLITLGGLVIAFFMSHTNLSSALEAAGSFVVLLTGFYYFAQFFLLGAVITRVYAHRYGSLREKASTAEPLLNT
jgi:membrane protein